MVSEGDAWQSPLYNFFSLIEIPGCIQRFKSFLDYSSLFWHNLGHALKIDTTGMKKRHTTSGKLQAALCSHSYKISP